MSFRRPALIAIVLTALLAAVLPTAHAATAPSPSATTIGVSPGGDLLWMSDDDLGRTLDGVRASGATMVRVPVPWAIVEPTAGQWSWQAADRVVSAARARSLDVLVVLSTTPAWAVTPGQPAVSGMPASPSAYATFAAAAAQRYRTQAVAFEVWNEPNGSMFLSPTDPAGYTRLLKAAYPRIKAVAPRATVVAGSLGAAIDSPTTVDPVRFLAGMYAAGAAGSFDALSFHPYHHTLPFTHGSHVTSSPVDQTIELRRLMVTRGDASKKIWATEYGVPTSVVDEQTQAALIADLLAGWRSLPYAGPVLIHSMRDLSTGGTDPEETFGLMRTDWTHKPALEILRAFAAGSVPPSAAATRFARLSSTYGSILGPVFEAAPTVWAQVRSVGTVYDTPRGLLTSPEAVADLARPFGLVPTTRFANGYQDFVPHGLRIFSSAATGTHLVGGGIVAAWTSTLGLATSGEVPIAGGVMVTFQHGAITWTSAGATVTRK